MCQGLEAALNLYEQGLNMAVDAVSSTVTSALDLAQSAIQAFGALAAIAPDIAANPSQWVSNFGSSVEGGIEGPTLWEAFKAKTEEWFGGKVEEVTSLTPEQMDDLEEGGFGFAEVAKMVWDNIVGAIPGILIGILLEKLVSMLVPALGAVLTIIESLQAAWGTVSQILTAFTLFVGFLQAVKTGTAAPLFAGLLAAAGIVLLDFVAQWMIAKLMDAAKAIAGRLMGTADEVKAKREGEDNDDSLEDTDEEQQHKKKDDDCDCPECDDAGHNSKLNQQDEKDDEDTHATSQQEKDKDDEEESLENSTGSQQTRNNQDVERDKAAEEDLPGGHKVKVTEDGDVYACSTCKVPDLPDDQQREVDAAKTPEEKAERAKDAIEVENINSQSSKAQSPITDSSKRPKVQESRIDSEQDDQMQNFASQARKRKAEDSGDDPTVSTGGSDPEKAKKVTGQELAEAKGLEEFPKEGYRWYADEDGKLKVRNEEGNGGPILNYDESTGKLSEKPNVKPKPDFKAIEKSKETISHKDINSDYENQLKTHAKNRRDHQDNKKNANDSGDKAKASEEHSKMVSSSEQLGEVATDAASNYRTPDAQRLKSDLPGDGKTGEFDRIYQDANGVYIYEAKGAGGTRIDREVGEGKRGEQGTPEYRDSIISNMEKKLSRYKRNGQYPDEVKELEHTLKELDKAKQNGTLKYFQVNQKVTSSGELKDEIEIIEFENTSSKQ